MSEKKRLRQHPLHWQHNIISAWNAPYESDDTAKGVDLEAMVTSVIHLMGVPAHVNGYFYLREAIIFMVNDQNMIKAVTKIIYPNIAERFNTTAPGVECGIRYAIDIAWDRCDFETRQKFFGYTALFVENKPTNSEFIATVADRLKLQIKAAG